MPKDMEPYRPGSIQPVEPGSEPSTFVPYAGSGFQIGTPDFTMIRPPETGGRIQDGWARNPLVLAFRAMCRSGLWLTEFWWRPAILFAIIAALVTIFLAG